MKRQAQPVLWQLAFRPFFLFGSAFAIVAIGLWLCFLYGVLPYSGYLPLVTWHSHEMVYGFATSAIAGFVLTAVQNWTGMRGIHGARLQFIFALWLLARVLSLFFPHASVLTAGADLAFYPLLGMLLFPYLRDPELKVERVFFAYFLLFFGGNLLVHLDSLGLTPGWSRRGILLGLNTLIVVMVFMGGRVIPFFTESNIAKKQPRTRAAIEPLCHVSAWLFLTAQFFAPDSGVAAAIAFLSAGVHLVRLQGWYVRRIRRAPLIWVLHASYLWIVIGFALSGFSSIGLIPQPIAIHAFAVGAAGMMIYGMITRVSLGHTGRPLIPAMPIVVGYVLLAASAVTRVFGPLISGNAYTPSLIGSGLLWIAAFALLLFVYIPILTSPRVDGKEG